MRENEQEVKNYLFCPENLPERALDGLQGGGRFEPSAFRCFLGWGFSLKTKDNLIKKRTNEAFERIPLNSKRPVPNLFLLQTSGTGFGRGGHTGGGWTRLSPFLRRRVGVRNGRRPLFYRGRGRR